jgi:hypothetical protein
MRRRRLLGLAGSVGLAGLTGCAAFGGPSDPAETLTPAEVPASPTPTATATVAPARSPCPELPGTADRYVCASELTEGLRLVPTTSVYDASSDGLEFVFTNRTDRPFETGEDWWTLAQRTREGWSTVDAGAATDELTVEPGGTYGWLLGGTTEPGPGVAWADTDFGGGDHAFVVTGEFGGDRTAVIAPFRVEPAFG